MAVTKKDIGRFFKNLIPFAGLVDMLPDSEDQTLSNYTSDLEGLSDYERSLIEDLNKDSSSDTKANTIANLQAYQLTKDQREFDTAWRDNEREYTSPQAQLDRLMATGLSRSAALAQLQESSAGSASGLTPEAYQTPVMPSETAQRKMDTALQPFQTLSGLCGSVGGLVNLGLNVPSILANNQVSQAQAMSSRYSASALQGMQMFNKLVGSAQDNGLNLSNLTNTGDFLHALRSADPNKYPELSQFMNGGAFNELYSNPIFRQDLDNQIKSYSSTIDPERTYESLHYGIQMKYGALLMQGVERQQLHASIAKINSDIDLNHQSIYESQMRENLYQQQSYLTKEQTRGMRYENDIEKLRWAAYQQVAPSVTAAHMNHLHTWMNECAAMASPEYMSWHVRALLNNDMASAAAAQLAFTKDNMSLQFASDPANASYCAMALAFDQFRLTDFIKMSFETGGTEVGLPFGIMKHRSVGNPLNLLGNGYKVGGINFATPNLSFKQQQNGKLILNASGVSTPIISDNLPGQPQD